TVGARSGKSALCIWDIETGYEWPALTEVPRFQWGKDGQVLITTGPSFTGKGYTGTTTGWTDAGRQTESSKWGYVHLWEVTYPTPTFQLDGIIQSLSFNRDGSRLVANESLWEVMQNVERPRLQRSAVTTRGFFPRFVGQDELWIVAQPLNMDSGR